MKNNKRGSITTNILNEHFPGKTKKELSADEQIKFKKIYAKVSDSKRKDNSFHLRLTGEDAAFFKSLFPVHGDKLHAKTNRVKILRSILGSKVNSSIVYTDPTLIEAAKILEEKLNDGGLVRTLNGLSLAIKSITDDGIYKTKNGKTFLLGEVISTIEQQLKSIHELSNKLDGILDTISLKPCEVKYEKSSKKNGDI